jgi:hypothetical protein
LVPKIATTSCPSMSTNPAPSNIAEAHRSYIIPNGRIKKMAIALGME